MSKIPKKFINNNKLIGQLVYCTTDRLKSCVFNKVYRIENYNPLSQSLKLEGIKTWLNWYNFDFLENNPALMRDFNIRLVLDEAQIQALRDQLFKEEDDAHILNDKKKLKKKIKTINNKGDKYG